jgi:hypothetical protein
MPNIIEPIVAESLSVAWAKGFVGLMQRSQGVVTPMIVSITGFTEGIVTEDLTIRSLLDRELTIRHKSSCNTVANTIFPLSMWNARLGSSVLYDRYSFAWPRIKRYPANRRGVYFQRFIAYDNSGHPVNQLQHIIETWRKGNHRHSALQAAVFDPRHDHNDCRQLGFPCLHQVSFTPLGTNGRKGLAVTGFYGTQHMFEKAYGNFLGLCRLGRFMAKEMNLSLVQVNCIAALEKLGDGYAKEEFHGLEEELLKLI